MVFLMLDYNQENPLHRSPIGKNPKVRVILRQIGTFLSLFSAHSRYWNGKRLMGNVSLTEALFGIDLLTPNK